MAHLVAAIDAGTTSTRCVLFDRQAVPVATAQKEHRQITPRPGWVEHDPAELWANTAAVIVEALARADAIAGDIAAIGLTNQRETTIASDCVTGRPVYNAIVWSDARTADLCAKLRELGGIDRFRDVTGLPLATYFSATKMAWLQENIPAVRGREVCFGTVDSWLLWHLTGRFATDVTNASRTLLMSLETLDWSDELLGVFGVARSMLPSIQPSVGGDFGTTKPTGPFGGAIPVTAVLGDQQAALFGQCCFGAGEAKSTYGTGCFMLLNTGGDRIASTHGLLTTPACQVAGEAPTWALEGSVAVAGSAVQWLRDNLEIINSSAEVESLANSVDDSGGVIFVPAFGGCFAPHWDASARGTLLGITAQTTKAHIARATLDAVAYQAADVFDAMQADAGCDLKLLSVDGGMTVNDRLLQFQADILGVPVARPAYVESTAAGAAYAAGLAVGFWPNRQALRELRRVDRTFESTLGEAERGRLRATWSRALGRARGWVIE